MEQQQNQKVFSFVSLPGVNQKKRPRRKYHEVERLYHCNYMGCSKSYGTLNHLNAHVQMQDHGPKRHPSEFKELRKMWRKQKRENQGKHKKNGSSNTSSSQQMEQQQRQQETRPSPHHSVQSHHHIPLPSIPSHQVQPMIHHSLPPPPPLPTVLYPPPSNHWMAAIPSQHHHPTALSNMTQLHQPQHTSHPHHQSAAAAGFTTNNMNY
ncbi:hypothetical protein BC941DRAFT_347844 [Chlamydoabsidia padenii]|nr:hypothetical protein BC941DRAFT_347844 [Chlamydoabsidia padenii]